MAATPTTVATNAGPARPAPGYLQRLRSGDEAAYVITFMAAAAILAITGLLVLELYTNSAASRAKFGAGVSWSRLLGTRSTISSARSRLFTEP